MVPMPTAIQLSLLTSGSDEETVPFGGDQQRELQPFREPIRHSRPHRTVTTALIPILPSHVTNSHYRARGGISLRDREFSGWPFMPKQHYLPPIRRSFPQKSSTRPQVLRHNLLAQRALRHVTGSDVWLDFPENWPPHFEWEVPPPDVD